MCRRNRKAVGFVMHDWVAKACLDRRVRRGVVRTACCACSCFVFPMGWLGGLACHGVGVDHKTETAGNLCHHVEALWKNLVE